MDILDSRIDFPQRFTFLPMENDRTRMQSTTNSTVIARYFLLAEFAISFSFNIALLFAIRHGHYLSLLLCIITTMNCTAAAILLTRKRPLKSASPIAVFVIWKVFQDIVLVPVLVVFTFLMFERFIDSWLTPFMAYGILAVVWLYAIYSIAAILFLGQFARTLWKNKALKRRCSFSSISTITRTFDLTADPEAPSTSSHRIGTNT